MCEFSDISDDEFQMPLGLENVPSTSSSTVQSLITAGVVKSEVPAVASVSIACEFSDISDDDFQMPVGKESVMSSSRFKSPVSSAEMSKILAEKFARKTIDKATWAVTLFSQWRADRNVRCLSDDTPVYINKPFGSMTDDELIYTVPLFLTEVMKKDGTEFPPATLRDLVLSL